MNGSATSKQNGLLNQTSVQPDTDRVLSVDSLGEAANRLRVASDGMNAFEMSNSTMVSISLLEILCKVIAIPTTLLFFSCDICLYEYHCHTRDESLGRMRGIKSCS